MNQRVEYGEREINLLHLVCYMLEKYKSLIVAVVIGLVVSVGVSFVLPEVSNENVVSIEDYEPTDEMLHNMEMASESRGLYEKQKEYNENSLIMQLNPNKVYEGRLVYYVSTPEMEEKQANLYLNVIQDEQFLEEAAEEAKTSVAYIKEVIRTEFNVDIPERVVLAIIHFDKDICGRILKIMENYVNKYQQTFEEEGIVHKLEKVADSLVERTYADNRNVKNSNIDWLNNLYNKMITYEDKLVDEDLLYYQTYYLDGEEIAEEEEVVVENGNSILKFGITGFMVAVFVWLLFWGIQYLVNNKIYTKESAERYYNLPVIGHVDVSGEKCLYRRLKKYSFDTEEYIRYALEELEKCGVVVTGYTGNKLDSKQVYCFNEYLSKNQKAMEKAKEVKCAVIGIQLNNSTYKDIEREIEMCIVNKVDVIGMLVFE